MKEGEDVKGEDSKGEKDRELVVPRHRRRVKSFRSPMAKKNDENNPKDETDKTSNKVKKEKPCAPTMVKKITTKDNWEVETRKRIGGKLGGSLYKVWTSPNGTKYYSLKKAKDAGFKGEEGCGSGDGNPGPDDDGNNERKGKGRKRQKKA